MKIIVSACLLGIHCRYNGECSADERILPLFEEHELIPVCPEQLGGLSTPRDPDEIKDGKVFDSQGIDNSEYFKRGAEEVLKITKLFGAKCAVLKERSPSCGSFFIYDGTFTGKVIPGEGITSSLLRKNGIIVFSEENFDSEELHKMRKIN